MDANFAQGLKDGNKGDMDWFASKGTEACCTNDFRCSDQLNMEQKIERFENKACCERLAIEAAKVFSTVNAQLGF